MPIRTIQNPLQRRGHVPTLLSSPASPGQARAILGLVQVQGRIWLRGVAAALLLLLAAASANAAPSILTQTRQVHDLPSEQAAQSIPVHLIATVTYYQPREGLLFVEDASGAVFVRLTRPYPIHRGDQVEIDGFTASSFRTIVATNPRIRLLGAGAPFAARPVSYQQLVSGEADCRYISFHGIVRSAILEDLKVDKVALLQVLVPGGIVEVYVRDYKAMNLTGLIDADIQLSGTAAAEFNARFQQMRPLLYVSGPRQVEILHQPGTKPLNLPITSIDNVLKTRFILDQSKRVRVRGAVTSYEPGESLVIQHDGRSLLVMTQQIDPLPLGSVVDVIGFADDHGYAAILEGAQFFPTGMFEQVAPRLSTYSEAYSGAVTDSLITLSGRVLSQLYGELSDTLVLLVDQHPVSVVLPARGRAPLPNLPPGTLVTVTGICRVTPSREWGKPLLFRLDLRQSSDLVVLARPSWWTVTHLLLMVGALLAVFFCVMVWLILLRRRVAAQTRQIERSIRVERERSRLLEEINSEAPLEQLLADICNSIATLIPNVRCSCPLREEPAAFAPERGLAAGSGKVDSDEFACIYEAGLTDEKGRRIGAFRVESKLWRRPTDEEKDTLAAGASLANLAVNQRRMYQELNYCSTHDQLTALPNRRLADTRLEAAIRDAAARGARVGVAYIDVDQFKQVNDQHGHKAGDLYLQQIASRLGAKIRAQDLLARIGGDEFLLIAAELHSLEDGEVYKRRLQTCFEDSFALDGVRVRGSASIGVAVFPDHGDSPEALKRHADTEMYLAKHRDRRGHGAHQDNQRQPKHFPSSPEIFSPAELQAALDADRFTLFYQPQFSAQGQLRGLEALIRLNDPILGIVTPDAFIGVAERSDFVFPMGAWVLRQALADAAHWQVGLDEDVRIIVNVSARQIEQPGFADQVALALLQAGIPGERLELEITERCVLEDMSNAVRQLTSLRSLGIRVSIDDFGTEQSCLNILHKLPLDTLKIDRSFVRVIRSEPEVLRVIAAIVQLARSMGKRIVAEGVESEEEIATLLQMGDMDFQGYAFSRPIAPENIRDRIGGWRQGIRAQEVKQVRR